MKHNILMVLLILLSLVGCNNSNSTNISSGKNHFDIIGEASILNYQMIDDIVVKDKPSSDDVYLINDYEELTLISNQENIPAKYQEEIWFDNNSIIVIFFNANAEEYSGGVNLEYFLKREKNIEIVFSVQSEYRDEVIMSLPFAIKVSKNDIEDIEEFVIKAYKRSTLDSGSKYHS